MRARLQDIAVDASAFRLRWPKSSDVKPLAAALNDLDVARMTGRIPHPYERAHARNWVSQQARLRRAGDDFAALIVLPRGEVAGCVGLHRRDQPEFELGYWVARPYWGGGLATRAAAQMMAWAQARLRVQALLAAHFVDNPASARVLEKLGFRPTGGFSHRPCTARGGTALSREVRWEAPPLPVAVQSPTLAAEPHPETPL